MVVRFQVVSPVAKRRTFTVRLPIMLGRGDEAKFRIQHDLVSRRHCELFERHGQVYIRDLGSTNGTFLNDEQVPVSTKTVVPPGGIVRVGGLSFAVEYQPPATAEAAAAVDGHVGRDEQAAEESRVDAVHEAATEEQPDFQVLHEDDDAPAAPSTMPSPDQGAAAATEPLETTEASAADTDDVRETVAADAPADEPTAAPKQSEGFDFLSDAAAPTSESPQWPAADNAAADASDDDQLNSFFKGLK